MTSKKNEQAKTKKDADATPQATDAAQAHDPSQHEHVVEQGMMAGHPPEEKPVDTTTGGDQPSLSLGEEQQLAQIDQQEAAKAEALKDAPKRPTKAQQAQIDAETQRVEEAQRRYHRAQTDPRQEYLDRVAAGSDMAPAPDAEADDDAEDDQAARQKAAAARGELRGSFGDYTIIPEGDRYRVEAMIDGDLTVAIFTVNEFAAAADSPEGRDAYVRDRLLEIAGKGA